MFRIVVKDPSGNFVLDKDELSLIEEFKVLLDRDKGSFGFTEGGDKFEIDYEGKLKKQAHREFQFLWNYCDIFSPFVGMIDSPEKVKKCIEVSGLNKKFKPTPTHSYKTWNRSVKGWNMNETNLWNFDEVYFDQAIIHNAVKRYRQIQEDNSPTVKSYLALKRFINRHTEVIEVSESGSKELLDTLKAGVRVEVKADGVEQEIALTLQEKAQLRDLLRKEMEKTLELADDIKKAQIRLTEFEQIIKNELEEKQNPQGGGLAGLTEMPGYTL